MEENEIGKEMVDAAVMVHSALGPGLLESVYEVVLTKELERSLSVARHAALMEDGIKRMINGLEDENLGVFGSLRGPNRNSQQSGGGNVASRRATPGR